LRAAGRPFTLLPFVRHRAPAGWEIIIAAAVSSTDAIDVYEAPVLDVSYGLSTNIQISARMPYVSVDREDGGSASDHGHLELGFKWRFLHDDRLQLAVAPLYLFGFSASAAKRGIDTEPVANMHVLFLVGSGFRAPQDNELNFDAYLGLQFFR
jgi:hypothetical protein